MPTTTRPLQATRRENPVLTNNDYPDRPIKACSCGILARHTRAEHETALALKKYAKYSWDEEE